MFKFFQTPSLVTNILGPSLDHQFLTECLSVSVFLCVFEAQTDIYTVLFYLQSCHVLQVASYHQEQYVVECLVQRHQCTKPLTFEQRLTTAPLYICGSTSVYVGVFVCVLQLNISIFFTFSFFLISLFLCLFAGLSHINALFKKKKREMLLRNF